MATAKLTKTKVAKAAPGRHGDGGGLTLIVSAPGVGRWVFRYSLDGKQYDFALGTLSEGVDLDRARELRDAARLAVEDGRHPKAAEAARRESRRRTFGDCAEAYLESVTTTFTNAKHKQQWNNTLMGPTREGAPDYCAAIRDLPVADINTDDLERVLAPWWSIKPETARRVQQRIYRVLGWAGVKGYRSGPNPAQWEGHLRELLHVAPKVKLDRRAPDKVIAAGHQPALEWGDIPDFYNELQKRRAPAARCLEFIMLSGLRSGEARGLLWDEVDLDAGIVTIEKRMKGGRSHVFPISSAMDKLLRKQHHPGATGLVFPSEKKKLLSDSAMSTLIKNRLKIEGVTAHGMRSSFRDWAGDHGYPEELCEHALAHNVGNAVQRAYRRKSALELRKPLMESWGQFVTSDRTVGGDNVVRLHG